MRYLPILLLVTSCGSELDDSLEAVSEEAIVVGSRDRPESVDVVSWNVEWFGSTREGPSNEALQLSRARDIISGLDVELVGLVEIVSAESFRALLDGAPRYRGLLANDPSVTDGSRFYTSNEQKPALLVREGIEIESARLILTAQATIFGGRPPLEARLRFTVEGRQRTLVVIIAHLKAMADQRSYNARAQSAEALKQYLDTEHPTRWVLVIGDFNDDLDQSTYRGLPSPFRVLLDDRAHYRFTTEPLTLAGEATTTSFPATIDHHLATNELAAREVAGSAQVLRLDRFIPSYAATTSDHYPVLSRYDLR